MRAGAEEQAARINAELPGRAIAFEQDVTSERGWSSTFAAVEGAFGGLNILVNNAGIGSMASVEDESS